MCHKAKNATLMCNSDSDKRQGMQESAAKIPLISTRQQLDWQPIQSDNRLHGMKAHSLLYLDAQLPERGRPVLPIQLEHVIDDWVLAPLAVHLQDVDVIKLREVHELVESDELPLRVLLSECAHYCRPRQAHGVIAQEVEVGHGGPLFVVQKGVERAGLDAKRVVDVLLELVLALAAYAAQRRSYSAVKRLGIHQEVATGRIGFKELNVTSIRKRHPSSYGV